MSTTQANHLISKRDEPDERDFQFTPRTVPPAAADLRQYCDGAYNQLPLKSCSANAISAALTLLGHKAGTPILPPSRLFLYYNSRVLEGDTAADDGVTLRNAIKAAAKPGVCPESLWPYDPAQFATAPPQTAYNGISTRALSYYRINRDLHALKSCIAEGFPFVFGINAYEQSFFAAAHNGQLEMPAANDTLMGGHACLAVGYDDGAQRFTVLNSLGATWGAQGYFTIPYAYLLDDKLAYDFWTIREIG
ncbi:MAG: C1 family peptidase [Candidatus Eremiobacteraeota bacterium]|nr:C1 family peptidase [Candidatus Eremiobacteraeota bacterium]